MKKPLVTVFLTPVLIITEIAAIIFFWYLLCLIGTYLQENITDSVPPLPFWESGIITFITVSIPLGAILVIYVIISINIDAAKNITSYWINKNKSNKKSNK